MLELANIFVDCIGLFSVVGDISLSCVIIVQYALNNNTNVCFAIKKYLILYKDFVADRGRAYIRMYCIVPFTYSFHNIPYHSCIR